MRRIPGVLVGIVIALAVVLVLWVVIGREPAGREGLPKFSLSVNTWVGFGPFWLAEEKGFFEEEGVDVDISVIDDTAQRKAAVVKGDVDGLGDTVDLLVLARAENVPSVAVMQVDVSNGADGILVTDAVRTVQDLKGKKIAVQKNFVSEAFLNYVLQKNGLKPSDVQTIDMEAGAAGAAFVAGQVDAAVTFEPWLSKAKERRGGRVLISTADEPGVIVDILSVNEQYLTDNAAVVRKVMRAWFKAVDYWRTHQGEASALMAKHYNVSPTEFAELISGLVWPTYQENVTYFGSKERPVRIYEVAGIFADLFVATGQIKQKPDLTQAIDERLLSTLYDEQ